MTAQSFTNNDDWFHLDVALGLWSGDGAAWAMVLGGDTSSGDPRVVPFLFWLLDWLLYGLGAGGYYGTNFAIHATTAAALYVVIRKRSDAWAALAGAAVFAFEPVRAEPLVFLSAREDGVAVALVALTLAAWPRLRRSRRGVALAALLYLLACFSKAPAIVLPGMLAALDRADGAPGRRWLPLLAVGAGWGLYCVAIGTFEVNPGSVPASLELVARRLAPVFAPWPLLVLLVVLGARRDPLRRLGGVWIGWGLLVVAPWLARGDAAIHGRYLLLSGLGAGVLAAGVLPRRGALRVAMALALVGLSAWRFASLPPGGLPEPDRASARLIDELLKAPPGVTVALGFPHSGIEGLLASPARGALLPGQADLHVVLQGRATRLRGVAPQYGYPDWEAVGPLMPGERVLAKRQGGWGSWTVPRPAASDAPAKTWRFDRGAEGWSGGWRGGLLLPARSFPLSLLAMVRAPDLVERLALGAVESPPLRLDPRSYCWAELRWMTRDLPTAPPPRSTLLEAGAALVLRWAAEGEQSARRALVVPVLGEAASVELWTVPDWVEASSVHRLSLMPMGFDGELVLRELALLPCSGE